MPRPYQNRVTPAGDLIATPARGTRMGNRGGCLHDDAGRIVRPYHDTHWIICDPDYPGPNRHAVMAPGLYTHLFFLDEVTALAAGHRPCATCQRARFNAFRTSWAQANPDLAGSTAPLRDVVDGALHRERIDSSRRKVTYDGDLKDLPNGCFVTLLPGGQPHLVLDDRLLPWTPEGYQPAIERAHAITVQILTPASIVRALKNGFAPVIHPTAIVSPNA
jgi:hypothetical protein